jgi:hypothetical protein
MLYRVHLAMSGIRGNNLVVIGTDFTGSCKANYHTTMTASKINLSSDVVNFVSLTTRKRPRIHIGNNAFLEVQILIIRC